MSKLRLPESCFTEIDCIKKCEVVYTDEHKKLVNEANKKIDEALENRRIVYENAENYFVE